MEAKNFIYGSFWQNLGTVLRLKTDKKIKPL